MRSSPKSRMVAPRPTLRPCSSGRALLFRALATTVRYRMVVAQAMRRAGVTCPSRGAAHVLRHSVASSMLRQGASLQEIAGVLRHRSIATTEIYAKIDVVALPTDCAAMAGGETMLTQNVESYLAVRRAMGFALHSEGTLFAEFCSLLRSRGKGPCLH